MAEKKTVSWPAYPTCRNQIAFSRALKVTHPAMQALVVNLALLALHLAPCPPKTTHVARTALISMQVNDGGAAKEMFDETKDEEQKVADEAADAAGAAARAAIADTRTRAEAAVAALRAEIDAADGKHAVTKLLSKKGSLSPSGELADALRKPPGTIAIIAEGAQIGSVSLGGFDLDDPVFLSGEFRRGNAAAVMVGMAPEARLSKKAVKDTAEEQQTALGEFPGPIAVIARDDFMDEVQLAQAAADGATAVVLPLQLNARRPLEPRPGRPAPTRRGGRSRMVAWRGAGRGADGRADGGGGGAGPRHAGARRR